MSGFEQLRGELMAATRRQAEVEGEARAEGPMGRRETTDEGRPARPPARARKRRVLRCRGHLPALVTVAVLGLGGAAVAAVQLLDTGAPVPGAAGGDGGMVRGAIEGARVLPLRAADPGGGLPWGIMTFRSPSPREVIPGLEERGPRPALTCVMVGRVQEGVLGVVGRDGTFGDDGRFHPLDPRSAQGGMCGGGTGDAFVADAGLRSIPASGYTGGPQLRSGGRRVAGCNDPVERSAPGQSPCPASSMRQVKAGFAGPLAERVVFENRRLRLELRPEPGTSGAYLFVYRATDAEGGGPMRLTAVHRGGIVCRTTETVGMTGPERSRLMREEGSQPGCAPAPGVR